MEVGYASAADTIKWIDAYSAVSGRPIYYDTGDAGGCPTSGSDYTSSTQCATTYTYTIDQVKYKAYGAAPAYPFPQIYRNDGAMAFRWQKISKYASGMPISGVLSESQACKGSTDSICAVANQGPTVAYKQLSDKLNADTVTKQTIPYVTDVSW